MSTFSSRLRARLIAVAIGAVPIALGGGALAVATTPPPPPPTPSPTPVVITCDDAIPTIEDLEVVGSSGGRYAITFSWSLEPGCEAGVTEFRFYLNDGYLFSQPEGLGRSTAYWGLEPNKAFRLRIDAYRADPATYDEVFRSTERTFTTGDTPVLTPTPAAPTPSPTPEPGATPTITPIPSVTPTPKPQLCIDPAPGQSDPYAEVTKVTDRSATFTWTRFGCREELSSYDILLGGRLIEKRYGNGWAGTVDLTGLMFNTTYWVQVLGRTGSGDSVNVASASFTTGPPDETGWFNTPTPTPSPTPTPTPNPPTPTATPTGPFCSVRAPLLDPVTLSDDGTVSPIATLSWSHPPGCDNNIASYNVYLDDVLVKSGLPTGSRSYELRGLTYATKYSVRIAAVVGGSGEIASSSPLEFTTQNNPLVTPDPGTPTPSPVAPTPPVTPVATPPIEVTRTYATRGALAFRGQGLVGNFALKTTTSLRLRSSNPVGVFATLPTLEATGYLTVAGVVPIRTQIAVTSGEFSGLRGVGTLSGSSTHSIVVRKATLLGLTLTSGSTCTTTAPVTLGLAGPFDEPTGGKLSAVFAVGKFTGCGLLNSYLSSGSPRSSLTLRFAPQR